MSDVIDKIEFQAQKYMEMKKEKDMLDEKMNFCKNAIMRLMKENKIENHQCRQDENYDIKITYAPQKKKVLDKEGLGEKLRVETGTINRDLLIKAAQDGKLTLEQFKGFVNTFYEPEVRLRRVKA